ncbi:MAG: LPS assembly lipoprotein LptE [Gammaproteobacteria bacterium]|nr:LPS assembly lipoprotein LptE [Gammaproteobacteria bacterium]
MVPGTGLAECLILVRTGMLLCLVLLLGACGFHLRGLGSATDNQIETLYLTTADPYSQMSSQLIRQLERMGVELVASGASADVQVSLSRERFSRRAASTTSNISVAEYELRLEVDLTLSRPGKASGDPPLTTPVMTLSEESVYTFDNTSLVGSNEEESLLLNEMRRLLVEEIIRRTNSVVAQDAPLALKP